ncbi:MAG: hypothetical protein FJZ04_01245 [Candidatus Moranbacteria bacterium]|nr:hypothetical protein [Candidatus Moranbacteria bacterium]
MNRQKFVLAIVVFLILVLGGGYFALVRYKKYLVEEKITEDGESDEDKKTATGQSVNGTSPLPVTDTPEESSSPTAVGQIPIDFSNNQPKSNQQNMALKDISLDTDTWRTYANKKYGYSFKFPGEFDNRECKNENPCKFGQVYEKDGGNLVWITAQSDGRGWPYVTVAHYDNANLTLAKKQKLIDWFKAKFQGESVPQDYNYEIRTLKGDPKKAVKISFPQTPQSYAKEEIYFADGGNVFQIQLLDTNKSEAWEFYNRWLESFVWGK